MCAFVSVRGRRDNEGERRGEDENENEASVEKVRSVECVDGRRRVGRLFRPPRRFFGHRESRRRTLSPASVLNSARFASATTAEMAIIAMNTEVNTRHGRSCDHREYFARKPARTSVRGVASFRSPRASSSPVHASRARGVSASPGEADEADMRAADLDARALACPARSTRAEPEGTPRRRVGRLTRSTPTRRAEGIRATMAARQTSGRTPGCSVLFDESKIYQPKRRVSTKRSPPWRSAPPPHSPQRAPFRW